MQNDRDRRAARGGLMEPALEPAGRTGENNLGHSESLAKRAGAPSTMRATVKCKEIRQPSGRDEISPLRPKEFAITAVNSLDGIE